MLNFKMILIVLGLSFGVTAPVYADQKFEAFLQTLWPIAKGAGATHTQFEKAFAGITDPDPVVLKLAANQPEFTSTTSAYLAKAVTQARIDKGRAKAKEKAGLLNEIQARYGVDKYVLLAIWGMESNFGADEGSIPVMRALATLLYANKKTSYAREQLAAAFKMIVAGDRKSENFTGSWAAAMGHTQFIPTSYLSYAVDWDKDGMRDIWTTESDALASTANYLARAGWKNDRPWGWEVVVPKKFDRALIGRQKWRTVAEWEQLGVRRADGKPIAPSGAEGFLMVPQGVSGPVFLVTRNFMAIMDYNLSHSYALAVGHLGDRIRGQAAFVGSWPEVNIDLTFDERVRMQKLLIKAGHNPGGDDGRFGARTYEAIIAYQKKTGLPLDGVPSRAVLKKLEGQ